MNIGDIISEYAKHVGLKTESRSGVALSPHALSPVGRWRALYQTQRIQSLIHRNGCVNVPCVLVRLLQVLRNGGGLCKHLRPRPRVSPLVSPLVVVIHHVPRMDGSHLVKQR